MSQQNIEDAFGFCPRCGTPNPQTGRIPFRCQACDMACFFGPVAAVGALITDDEGRLLLVRRARNPGKGKWGLPGGFVDRDETIEAALRREVMEETRLVVTACTLMITRPNRYVYAGVASPVIDLFYECSVQDRCELKLAPDELDEHQWTWPTENQLGNMAFPSNKIAVEFWMDRTRV